MVSPRLSLLLDGAPPSRVAVYRPRSDADLYALKGAEVQIVQGFKPDFDAGLKGYVRKYAADLATLSYHSYSGSHCGTSKVTPTQMLSNISSSGRAEKYSFVVADAAAAKTPQPGTNEAATGTDTTDAPAPTPPSDSAGASKPSKRSGGPSAPSLTASASTSATCPA